MTARHTFQLVEEIDTGHPVTDKHYRCPDCPRDIWTRHNQLDIVESGDVVQHHFTRGGITTGTHITP